MPTAQSVNENETFREYIRRAKRDPVVRKQLERSARVSRSVFGWTAVLFAGAFLWTCASHGRRTGNWVPGLALFDSFGFTGNLLVWIKFGDRIAGFRALDETSSAPKPGESGPNC